MKNILCTAILFLMGQIAFAQSGVAMADEMYSSGKIYVVITCLAIIVICLFAYLFSIDRRIKKVEKNFPSKN